MPVKLDFRLKHTDRVMEVKNSVQSKPLVSVCIQTYNQEDFVKQCIESVLMQKTTFSFEILVGEDASIDGTRSICLDLAKSNPSLIRLFLHDRRNVISVDGKATGIYNMLYNLTKAEGKYIAFCEGDDFWSDESKLQEQVSFLERNQSYSQILHNTELECDGVINGEFRPDFSACNKSDFELMDQIRYRLIGHTSSLVFRSDCLTVPRWFRKVKSSDICIFTILASKGYGHFLSKNMSVYRVESGISGVKGMNLFYQSLRLNKFLNGFLKGEFIQEFRIKNHESYSQLLRRESFGWRYVLMVLSFIFGSSSSSLTIKKRLVLLSEIIRSKSSYKFLFNRN